MTKVHTHTHTQWIRWFGCFLRVLTARWALWSLFITCFRVIQRFCTWLKRKVLSLEVTPETAGNQGGGRVGASCADAECSVTHFLCFLGLDETSRPCSALFFQHYLVSSCLTQHYQLLLVTSQIFVLRRINAPLLHFAFHVNNVPNT